MERTFQNLLAQPHSHRWHAMPAELLIDVHPINAKEYIMKELRDSLKLSQNMLCHLQPSMDKKQALYLNKKKEKRSGAKIPGCSYKSDRFSRCHCIFLFLPNMVDRASSTLLVKAEKSKDCMSTKQKPKA